VGKTIEVECFQHTLSLGMEMVWKKSKMSGKKCFLSTKKKEKALWH